MLTLEEIKEANAYLTPEEKAEIDRLIAELEGWVSPFTQYQFDPLGYIHNVLHATPWQAQIDIIEAYRLALLQQHEKLDYENGVKQRSELEYWSPGQTIQNWISVDAGHTVGKTWLTAKLISHFFDCFFPSIIYCFAPTSYQINDLLFKEIRVDRQNRSDLPGKVLPREPRINHLPNHFIQGKATKDDKSTGTERTHGQHEAYQLFAIDESEGVEKYVFDAVRSMTSGGISIVLVIRNPRTTTCEAHKVRSRSNVAKFRISELDHPNVIEDREVIPNCVKRQYVLDHLEDCVKEHGLQAKHNPDHFTFEVPWQPGVIYRPTKETLWRVLGVASSTLADDTFCPVGRYEAATKRQPKQPEEITRARIGIDCARYGNDNGTMYRWLGNEVKRLHTISKQDGYEYYIKAKEEALILADMGVTDIQFRVDGGGGYGDTCIGLLARDIGLQDLFEEFRVIEVHNNEAPYDEDTFADRVTELYYHAGEALKEVALVNPPPELETDLCERVYKYVRKGAKDVKKLVPKEEFKKKFGRSPDDGDGAVNCLAPDHVFSYEFMMFRTN